MCPDELVYNKYTDRCDYSIEPISIGCGSMPCQYGSECIDITTSSSDSSSLYKCVCAPGYTGVNCEIAPDFCASNPCSGSASKSSKSSRNEIDDSDDNNNNNSNQCVSLSWDSPLPYYCLCGEGETHFGMTCKGNNGDNNGLERNPCIGDHEETIFATRIDPAIYVHCDRTQLTLKYCHKNTVFNPTVQTHSLDTVDTDTVDNCEWIDVQKV
jgi:hypothetical protein